MDTRRLQAFMKIVDAGSITRAADILHIAQPALSQQVSGLETQFGQQLLIRSKRGVVPTEAGKALYRHAQRILRQLELAEADVAVSARFPAGHVSVGLAPLSAGPRLGFPLLVATRTRYPDVLLHLNENFGGVLSEAIMTGRMDLALLYGTGPIRGVSFDPVLEEPLVLVEQANAMSDPAETVTETVTVSDLDGLALLLPSTVHTLRRVVDAALLTADCSPVVVGEVESTLTLGRAVRGGLGATILPASVAASLPDAAELHTRTIIDPELRLTLSLCSSDQQPLSEPATVVRDLLVGVLGHFADTHGLLRL
ncbi:nitrogen assimilation transcriptional regulator NAC [Pseudonocardia sp. DSM 110487]|uniref:nitrogen assimilation transcriptional regulator NAC n=1 Tax=Pseudonocardia sp. DSM 110487 TaxID=2865833 RepID=UPI001C6A0394|nr:nitrogen assimilation transcriptional regulator NAC [Pseudonocardia sp. DSM 110487]QYN33680.1 nitrogen assimilation transcriptional regulator NAC [Pseudonocardia sp. DSM 110487]